MTIKKKVGNTIYTPIGLRRKVGSVEYNIQTWYKGVLQNGSVVGVKVFQSSSSPTPPPASLIRLSYATPLSSISSLLSITMNKAWEIKAEIQSENSASNFFIGDAGVDGETIGTAYLQSTNGSMKCYGLAFQNNSKSLTRNKTLIDLNYHCEDPSAPGDYNWIFLNVDWNGVINSAGYQVTYAQITNVYNTNPVSFITDGTLRLFSLEEYEHDRNDKSTKVQVSSWLPYYDSSKSKVVWINSINNTRLETTDEPGPIYGAEAILFNRVQDPCYIYNNKAYSDIFCTTYYTAGTYTLPDRSLEYIIAADGTFTTQQPQITFDGKIRGTATPNSTFNLKINNSNRSVTADSNGAWELDAGKLNATSFLNFATDATAKSYLLTIDFSTFDWSTITTAQYLCYNNSHITAVTGLSGQNMSKVTNMVRCFSGTNISSLDMSNCILTKVTTMQYFMGSCTSLTSANFSGVETSNLLTDLAFFATGCTSLSGTVDLSGFNTTNIPATGLQRIFNSCSSLESIKLPSFMHGHGSTTDYMFNGCRTLTSITVPTTFKYNVWLDQSTLDRASALSLLNAYSVTAPESGSELLKFNAATQSLISNDTELATLWTTAQSLGWHL